MGNLCSMIDVMDAPLRGPRQRMYTPAHGGVPPVFTAAERMQQLQQLGASAEERNKRSPQASGSPERVRAGGGPGAAAATVRSDAFGAPPPEPDGEEWHIAAGNPLAADGDGELVPGAQLDVPPPLPPFSWTRGELVGIGAFGRVFTGLNNETGEIIAVKQVR